jgi:hypothetical protein
MGLFASSAIIVPYSLWECLRGPGSVSRVPVTIGVLLLCVISFLLSFSTTIRFSFLLQPPSAERPTQDRRDLESFAGQLRAVLQEIRDSGTHLYLVDYPTPGAERRVETEVRRIAQETGTDYIPLFDLIGNQIKGKLHDSIHPDRDGHRLIAEHIARVAAGALRP